MIQHGCAKLRAVQPTCARNPKAALLKRVSRDRTRFAFGQPGNFRCIDQALSDGALKQHDHRSRVGRIPRRLEHAAGCGRVRVCFCEFFQLRSKATPRLRGPVRHRGVASCQQRLPHGAGNGRRARTADALWIVNSHGMSARGKRAGNPSTGETRADDADPCPGGNGRRKLAPWVDQGSTPNCRACGSAGVIGNRSLAARTVAKLAAGPARRTPRSMERFLPKPFGFSTSNPAASSARRT